MTRKVQLFKLFPSNLLSICQLEQANLLLNRVAAPWLRDDCHTLICSLGATHHSLYLDKNMI